MVKLRQIDEYRWEIPREGKMRTRGLIFCSREMLPFIQEDQSLQQVANVATLPGIVGPSLAMPDIHWGYGFAIGGVAAFDLDEGVVSPGGVGYDINCGVRLLRTNLSREQVAPPDGRPGERFVHQHPLGGGFPAPGFQAHRLRLEEGAQGGGPLGGEKRLRRGPDLAHIEAGGAIEGADPDLVSRVCHEPGQGPVGHPGFGQPLCGSGVCR